jgi:hypothetical protein
MRSFIIGFVFVAAAGVTTSAVAATVLKQEPPMGKLMPGVKVLVDNGKCPSGQIQEVTGGDHRKVGGKKEIERSRRCVPR